MHLGVSLEASEERLQKLEAGLLSAQEELEACGLLLLALEGTAGGRQDTEETQRLKARPFWRRVVEMCLG